MKNASLCVLNIVSICLFGCNNFQEANSEKYELLPISFNFNKPLGSLDDYELRGNVKSVRSTTYDAHEKYGEIIRGKIRYPIYTQIFSRRGQLLEEERSNDSRIESFLRFEYNSKNDNLIKETSSVWSGNSEEYITSHLIKYSYDKHNRLNEFMSYHGNGDLARTESLQYDLRGKLIKSDVRDYFKNTVNIHYVYYFSYNSSNYLIEELEDDPDGSYERYTYKYDKRNRVSEVTGYNRNGWIKERRVYKYEGKNETEEIYYSGELFSTHKDLHIRSRDIEDLKALSSGDSTNKRYTVNLYTNGTAISIVPNKVLQQVLQYDKKKNWIVNIWFDENGSPTTYQERQIIYF